MHRLRRPAASLLLFIALAVGAGERVALHAHPIEENDLVPHSLSLIQTGPECGGDPHLDAARTVDHPVCPECALAASAHSVAVSHGVVLAGAARLGVAAPLTDTVPVGAARCSPDARAPPLS